jgi:D-3-phosphoglycerate dehydrogenase
MSDITVGIIGLGRIGSMVLDHLSRLSFKKILINDVVDKEKIINITGCEFTTKDYIYKNADLISLHLPLNSITKSLIGTEELMEMKKDAMLINTSRGGIVDEDSLVAALNDGHFSGVAIDVFSKEPYLGPLANFKRCLLTSHMGSMTLDCRARMEIEATEEALRLIKGKPLRQLVPEYEYEVNKVRG